MNKFLCTLLLSATVFSTYTAYADNLTIHADTIHIQGKNLHLSNPQVVTLSTGQHTADKPSGVTLKNVPAKWKYLFSKDAPSAAILYKDSKTGKSRVADVVVDKPIVKTASKKLDLTVSGLTFDQAREINASFRPATIIVDIGHGGGGQW